MSGGKALKPPSTKAADKRWKAGELRMLLAQLRIHLISGKSDLQSQEEMSLDTGDYNALKQELYEQEKLDINTKTIEQTFTDFTFRMEGCVSDLNAIISEGKSNLQAKVGAIRAKADIINKIIDRGQEFGLIEKVPERKQIVGGLLVAHMDNKGLREFITKQTGELGKLLTKYGEGNMAEETDPMPALPGLPAPKPAAAAVVEPTFGPIGKTGKAKGGLAKAAGGKATAHKPSIPGLTHPG